MLKDKKVMIVVPRDEASVIITKVENKKAEFEIIGNIKKDVIFDMEAYLNDATMGIIRKKDDKDAVVLELWEENSVKSGDILKIKNTIKCKDKILYGFNLSVEISNRLKEYLSVNLNDGVNDIHFTADNSENSVKSEVLSVLPEIIIIAYPVNATENFEVSKGCGIVFKDGNAVTEPNLRDFVIKTAERNNIPVQAYIGSQISLIETLGIIGNGAKVIPICIPVSYLNTRNEIVDINDIEAAASLILKIIGE